MKGGLAGEFGVPAVEHVGFEHHPQGEDAIVGVQDLFEKVGVILAVGAFGARRASHHRRQRLNRPEGHLHIGLDLVAELARFAEQVLFHHGGGHIGKSLGDNDHHGSNTDYQQNAYR